MCHLRSVKYGIMFVTLDIMCPLQQVYKYMYMLDTRETTEVEQLL